jgi:hypothetical protein
MTEEFMYTLIQSVPLRRLLATQAPSLLLAFLIAEFYYKWHSFTLECLGFLATWFVIDAAISLARSAWLARRGPAPTAQS